MLPIWKLEKTPFVVTSSRCNWEPNDFSIFFWSALPRVGGKGWGVSCEKASKPNCWVQRGDE